NDLKNAPYQWIQQSSLSAESFIFANHSLLNLKAKIEKSATPLKEWDIQINYGIKTGFNVAFIIDEKTRARILNACKSENERANTDTLIKKVLRGRDIKRYKYEWDNLYLIHTHNGYTHNGVKVPPIDIENYPSLKAYLDQHYKLLEKRTDKGNTPYNLRNCAYVGEFEKEKIVYSEIVSEPQFYLDTNEHFYMEATSFVLTGCNLRYLIALLNTSFIAYIFKTFYAGGGLGERGYRYKKAFIERLPIPKITEENQECVKKITDCVEQILKDKQTNKDTTILEQEIDKLVYQLYNLNDKEITLIENELKKK
ncbi:class I SAM-dependent DNA methyltransferase, partial [Helicobacter cetorum]|uniref:class I SAM-dependent DNA methyltransferase n=1 Tax=Helicobacter cetorum TaxID=138563 RepID=UPI0018F7FF98